jgi:hypothetical protein
VIEFSRNSSAIDISFRASMSMTAIWSANLELERQQGKRPDMSDGDGDIRARRPSKSVPRDQREQMRSVDKCISQPCRANSTTDEQQRDPRRERASDGAIIFGDLIGRLGVLWIKCGTCGRKITFLSDGFLTVHPLRPRLLQRNPHRLLPWPSKSF